MAVGQNIRHDNKIITIINIEVRAAAVGCHEEEFHVVWAPIFLAVFPFFAGIGGQLFAKKEYSILCSSSRWASDETKNNTFEAGYL